MPLELATCKSASLEDGRFYLDGCVEEGIFREVVKDKVYFVNDR